MNISPIKSESDYQKALERLDLLFDSPEGTIGSDEADILALLIDEYERLHYPIDAPDPVEAIKIRMAEMRLKQVDLVPILGGKNRVSEILHRKRRLTVAMIRRLAPALHLTPSLLIQDYPLAGREESVRP